MCYPCTQCGRCGKYNEDSVYYTPPAAIPCLVCGGEVDGATGMCAACGNQAFVPVTQHNMQTHSRSTARQRKRSTGGLK